MRTLVLILLTLPFSSFSQDIPKDSISLAKLLIGNWEEEFYVSVDTSGNRDTFNIKAHNPGLIFGIVVSATSCDEYIAGKEGATDTIAFFGEGPWELEYDDEKTYLTFDCEGMINCGWYELLSISNEWLILKSCSKYEYEGCQHTYFRKRED